MGVSPVLSGSVSSIPPVSSVPSVPAAPVTRPGLTHIDESSLASTVQHLMGLRRQAMARGGVFHLVSDLDGTAIPNKGEIDARTLGAFGVVAKTPGCAVDIVTHTGKATTLDGLLQTPGVRIIGDSGAYLFAPDGTVARWFVPQQYIDALNAHREALKGIIQKHLEGAPAGIKPQFKLLSMDVVYDKKVAKKEDVVELLKKIHADISDYLALHNLAGLLKADLRSYGDYWDLKVDFPIDKGIIKELLGEFDCALVQGDDPKYDGPMMRSALKMLSAGAVTLLVEGGKVPATDADWAQFTHIIGGVALTQELLFAFAEALIAEAQAGVASKP